MAKKLIMLLLITLFLSSALVICGYASFGIIPAEVYMEGVDISGLSIQEAENKLQETFARIDFVYKDFRYSCAPEDLGIEINYQASFEDFKDSNLWNNFLMNFKEKNFYLKKKIINSKISEILAELNNQISTQPQVATFKIKDGELLEVQEKWGTELDAEFLKAKLSERPLQNSYILPIKATPPKTKITELKYLKPNTMLAQFTTEFVKNPNRTENIKVACESIENTLLTPGEVFSFNDIVGPREEETGYLNAMVISGGEFVPGLGGGICQVSSTLYNAVLLAGLEIIERYPHSLAISYVPLGRDATVNYGSKDFRFKNNTDGYLLLDYQIEGQNLTLFIYGAEAWLQSVEVLDLPTQIIKSIPPTQRTVINAELKAGESKVRQRGSYGYLVESFRVKKINGKEEREFLARDYYSPIVKIVEKSSL